MKSEADHQARIVALLEKHGYKAETLPNGHACFVTKTTDQYALKLTMPFGCLELFIDWADKQSGKLYISWCDFYGAAALADYWSELEDILTALKSADIRYNAAEKSLEHDSNGWKPFFPGMVEQKNA